MELSGFRHPPEWFDNIDINRYSQAMQAGVMAQDVKWYLENFTLEGDRWLTDKEKDKRKKDEEKEETDRRFDATKLIVDMAIDLKALIEDDE